LDSNSRESWEVSTLASLLDDTSYQFLREVISNTPTVAVISAPRLVAASFSRVIFSI
jgi:hypothetical protein